MGQSRLTARVVALFAALIGGIVAPIGLVFLLALPLLTSPPYELRRTELRESHFKATVGADGVRVDVRKFRSPEAAREAAQQLEARISKRYTEETLGVRGYTAADGRKGLILPIDEVLVHAEGPDSESVERAIAALPFVIDHAKGNPAYQLFTVHLTGLLAGLGVYVVVYSLFFFRASSWAARIDPAPGVTPAPADMLRTRLLEINDARVPIHIRETERGYLLAEWRLADAEWTMVLEQGGLRVAHTVKMRLDPDRSTVRAIDFSKSVRWSRGIAHLGWSFSFFRGIVFFDTAADAAYGLVLKDGRWTVDAAYRYRYNLQELKKPLVAAVVSSGWTYQPVLTFWRWLGG